MLKYANASVLSSILGFLRQDVQQCLYMYIDISVYGLDNPNMRICYEEQNGQICFVLMCYYDTAMVYGGDEYCPSDGIIEFIRDFAPAMLSGKYSLVQKIYSHMSDVYRLSQGYVLRLEYFRKLPTDKHIELASEEDLPEIAELICADKIVFGHCTPVTLQHQFLDRMNANMGRNFILREEGKIMAHLATYAEYENIAVLSGFVSRPHNKHGIYGMLLLSYVIEQLQKENKLIFCYETENRHTQKLLSDMGNHRRMPFGKMVLRQANTL